MIARIAGVGSGMSGDRARGGGARGLAGRGVRHRRAQAPLDEVRRIHRRLVPGEQLAGAAGREVEEGFEGVTAAAEEALGRARVEIEAVEERAIPLGRRTMAVEVDRAPVLAHDPLAVRQHAIDRPPRVLVQLVARQIPDQARLRGGMIGVDQEGATPVAVVVDLVEERDAAALAPVEPAEALLGARQLARRAGERRGEGHDLVARRHRDVPVAAVERLGPDQRGRLGGAPGVLPRPGRDALDGDAVGDREARHQRGLSGPVPHLDVVRETTVGDGVRVRFADRGDQDVLAVRSGVDVADDAWLADAGGGAGARVDEGQLAGAVVLEARLVDLVGERVASLVGAELAGLAAGLLDARSL